MYKKKPNYYCAEWFGLTPQERVKSRTMRPNSVIGFPCLESIFATQPVNLSKHNHNLEPNVTFTPDIKRVVFRSNMFGPTHVFAVELRKAGAAGSVGVAYQDEPGPIVGQLVPLRAA
jgi:hypothetical protein